MRTSSNLINHARRLARATFALGALSSALVFSDIAVAEDISASSQVTAAIFYPDAASVTRSTRFEAPVGRHVILLEDAPQNLDPASLRISGDAASGAFEILSTERGVIALEPTEEQNAARDDVERRMEEVAWRLRAAEDAKMLAEERLSYLIALQRATTATGERSAGAALIGSRDGWDDAWTKLATAASEAAAARRSAERQISDLTEEYQDLEKELRRLGPQPSRQVLKVAIDVSEAVVGGKVDIVYLTGQAGWSPLYDLKLGAREEGADADKRPLSITRRAAVRQWTGENWTDVRVTLSTARPSGRLVGRTPHTMIAEIVVPVEAKPARKQDRDRSRPAKPAASMAPEPEAPMEVYADSVQEQGGPMDGLFGAVVAEEADERQLASESRAQARLEGERVVYELETALDVVGDGSIAFAAVGEETIDARIEVRAAPALEQAAYLTAIAEIEAALPPGVASIYRDGAYLGQTHLAYSAPGAEAELPFGPMESIRIKHQVVDRTRGAEGVFSTSATNRERFRMTAENLGPTELPIVLYAAEPVTEDERIEVSEIVSEKPSERGVKGRRGVVAWRFELAPSAKRDIDYGWDVAWPDGEQVIFIRR